MRNIFNKNTEHYTMEQSIFPLELARICKALRGEFEATESESAGQCGDGALNVDV